MTMKTYRLLFIGILLLALPFISTASNADWITLTNGDNVTSIVEDNTNRWIATKGGLVKMDKATKAMTYYNRLNSELPSNSIETLVIDEATGDLWIGTYDQGVVRFDGADWEIFNADNSGLDHNDVYTMQFDDDGNLWLGQFNNLTVYDGTDFIVYDLPHYAAVTTMKINSPTDIDMAWFVNSTTFAETFNWNGTSIVETSGISVDGLYRLYTADNGDTWACYNGGVAKKNGNGWIYYDSNNSSLPNTQARSLVEHNGELYLGTDVGIFMLENNDWVAVDEDMSGVNYMSSVDGGLWVGSNVEGLTWRTDAGVKTKYHVSNSKIPFEDPRVKMLLADDGKMWFTKVRDPEIHQFDGTTWTSQALQFTPDGIGRMATGANGVVWLLNGVALYKFDNGVEQSWDLSTAGVAFNGLEDVMEGPDGKVYMTTYGNGIIVFENGVFTAYNRSNSNISSNRINDIKFANGKVFIATEVETATGTPYGGGLEVFDGASFQVLNTQNSTIPSNDVYDLAVEGNKLWLVTDSVLSAYENGVFTNYSLAQLGLQTQWLKSVMIGPNGAKWITGALINRGELARWDGNTTTILNATNSPIGDYFYNMFDMEFDAEGNLWLSHGWSMFVYKEGGVQNINEELPTVGFSDIKNVEGLVSIYPNPTTDAITLNWNSEVNGELTVSVYDLSGKLAVQQSVNALVGDSTTLGLQGFNQGYYIYRITDASGNTLKATGKVLKQ